MAPSAHPIAGVRACGSPPVARLEASTAVEATADAFTTRCAPGPAETLEHGGSLVGRTQQKPHGAPRKTQQTC